MNTMTLKILMTIVLVVIGGALAVSVTDAYKDNTEPEASGGIIIEFGYYDFIYAASDVEHPDAFSALELACDREGYDLKADGGEVVSIDGLPESGSPESWNLYTVSMTGSEWAEYNGDPSDVLLEDNRAVAWGLCAPGESPISGLDATNTCVFGYAEATRIVSLAPSCTETICAVGGGNEIVGTDMYSNYPAYIDERRAAGEIKDIGGYTNPSYELILQLHPDLVVCIASQFSHISIAEKLRSAGINVVVTYDGESLDTVMHNTFIVGMALSEGEECSDVIAEQMGALDTLSELTESYGGRSLMISLSDDKAPWVSGSETYASSAMDEVHCINAFADEYGWVQINSEAIVKNNPQYIMVVMEAECSEEAYQKIIDGLSAEWRSTDAYKNGNIYVLTESATDLASRPSTRLAQFTELMARIVMPDAFDDDIVVPKIMGDDYTDYLSYTKDLSYDEVPT